MNRCIRVCEADAITNHTHSILIAFKNDRNDEKIMEKVSEDSQHNEHPIVCYVKADTTEEIRWWQNSLQVYAKQNAIHVQPSFFHLSDDNDCLDTVRILDEGNDDFYEETTSNDFVQNTEKLEPIVIQVCF